MEPFVRLTAVAAPYDHNNVDTDQIIPARFLLKRRTDAEYPTYLFHDLRFNADGAEKSDFVLNEPAFRGAKIFVGNENFGGGSSREAAAIALQTYGVRAVIAVTFGDIFYNNCIKNGVLPIRLARENVASLRLQLQESPGATLTIDLPAQTVTSPAGEISTFDIDGFGKTCLVEGLSQIDLTLRYKDRIDAFEERYRKTVTW